MNRAQQKRRIMVSINTDLTRGHEARAQEISDKAYAGCQSCRHGLCSQLVVYGDKALNISRDL